MIWSALIGRVGTKRSMSYNRKITIVITKPYHVHDSVVKDELVILGQIAKHDGLQKCYEESHQRAGWTETQRRMRQGIFTINVRLEEKERARLRRVEYFHLCSRREATVQ